MDLDIREIAYGSAEYRQGKLLRDAVLRRPLGLALSEEDVKQDPNNKHFGAFQEDVLVGCVMLHPVDAHTAQLKHMAIASDVQRHGVGRRLIAHFEAAAKALGYRTICMEARVTAQGFYATLGYQVVSEPYMHQATGLPHVKMLKHI